MCKSFRLQVTNWKVNLEQKWERELDMAKGKNWKKIADAEFAAMDRDEQAQWADLRELRM